MDDIVKSVKASLYERVSSPLYGTFVFSWLVSNWKIIYATIFVSEECLNTDRITYIENYIRLDTGFNWMYMVCLPLLSTLVITFLLPFASNGVYWVSLRFKTWRQKIKIEIESEVTLTNDQKEDLRHALTQQRVLHDQEIEKQKRDYQELSSKWDSVSSFESRYNKLFDKVKNNNEHFEAIKLLFGIEAFENVYAYMTDLKNRNRITYNRHLFDYLITHRLIISTMKNSSEPTYDFSPLAYDLGQMLLNELEEIKRQKKQKGTKK